MPANQRARTERTKRILGILLLGGLALLALAVLLAWSLGWIPNVTIQALEARVEGWGVWGVLASIGLMVAHSFVPFPAELLAIANGMVYGPVWGTLITWSGAMLGAYLAFGLARRLGRPFVETMVDRRDWHDLDDWTAREGGYVVLVARLIPVIAFNLINYAAGLTRISWWTFTWTTGLGILPLTVLMVVMGDSVHSLAWEWWLVLLAAMLVLWLLVRRRLRTAMGSATRRIPRRDDPAA